MAKNTGYSRLGAWCGWGGSRRGKGHEIGTKLEFGNSKVLIKSLHIHVHKQAYDSSFYRLHMRNIEDELPSKELLTRDIIFPITEKSGWVVIDLSNYSIILDGDVALSLEWVDVKGVNMDRAMKINDKMTSDYVLFNTKKRQGCIYTRWGTEANWTISQRGAPSIYLTVQ